MNKQMNDSGNLTARTKKTLFVLGFGQVLGFCQRRWQLLAQNSYGISTHRYLLSEF